MSFILDALRKSETERQRQAGPGLVDAGYRPPARRRSVWVPLLAVVLTANLALMAWYLLRPGQPGSAAPTASGGTAMLPAAAAPAAAPMPAAAPPAGRSLADAAGVAAPEEGPWEATADLPALEAAGPTEVLEVPPEPEAPGAPAATGTAAATGPAATAPGEAPVSSAIVADDLPTATQLIEAGVIPPQPLHLDIHVWSQVPAERFVFVNMRKYGEGAQLPDGARIEEITRDGVVLSQSGQRFVLSRD